jgi:hypothetical protein
MRDAKNKMQREKRLTPFQFPGRHSSNFPAARKAVMCVLLRIDIDSL